MKRFLRVVAMLAMVVGYATIAFLISYCVYRGGDYPAGSDTMCHVYKAQILLEDIKEGNWYPLYDRYWYNGVQMMRYWAPLPVYFIALCQWIVGGDVLMGHLVFIGSVFFLGGLSWLYIGVKKNRMFLGYVIGILWFFMPNNLYALFTEGNLPRSLSMVLLPLLIFHIYEWLFGEDKWKDLMRIIPVFALIALCHVGYAGMIAIALLIFLLLYQIKYHNGKKAINVIISLLLGFVIIGIWLYPSLKGGITSTDSSQVMKTFFQSAWTSVNPLLRFRTSDNFYFGLAALIVAVFGVVAAGKESRVGFLCALILFLGTTTTAYSLLVHLPGSQYLWMLRFISIALCLILYSLLYWKTLKKGFVAIGIVLLIADCIPSVIAYKGDGKFTARERLENEAESCLMDEARKITKQRVALIDGSTLEATGQYILTTLDVDKKVAQTYGAGWQSAATANNIVALNEAAERGYYEYLFDRALSMGNDTVLIQNARLKNGSKDLARLEKAAKTIGYKRYQSNGEYQLYHMETPEQFGTKVKHEGICIGTSGQLMIYPYPNLEKGYSDNLNDYSYDALKDYKVIYLANFHYDNLKDAEHLIRMLAASGVKIVIDGNGLPADKHSGKQEFLGVTCQKIEFDNGFPVLYVNGKEVVCALFERVSERWSTVYFNGLDDVTGVLYDNGIELAYMGTAVHENISFIGLNLPYHYFMTQDTKGSGAIMDNLIAAQIESNPQREVVPLEVNYEDAQIQIESPEDNVNTSLAFHDIFESEQSMTSKEQLLCVNKGVTNIKMKYPYFAEGAFLSIAAGILTAFYYAKIKKRYQS